jgi:hypothetical protein
MQPVAQSLCRLNCAGSELLHVSATGGHYQKEGKHYKGNILHRLFLILSYYYYIADEETVIILSIEAK